jgi:hypothetical protein
MLHFKNGLDIRTRQQSAPCVAKFDIRPGLTVFIVIGTQYGHIHTRGGDVRTWRSYSGARRFLRSYQEL